MRNKEVNERTTKELPAATKDSVSVHMDVE